MLQKVISERFPTSLNRETRKASNLCQKKPTHDNIIEEKEFYIHSTAFERYKMKLVLRFKSILNSVTMTITEL